MVVSITNTRVTTTNGTQMAPTMSPIPTSNISVFSGVATPPPYLAPQPQGQMFPPPAQPWAPSGGRQSSMQKLMQENQELKQEMKEIKDMIAGKKEGGKGKSKGAGILGGLADPVTKAAGGVVKKVLGGL